MDIVKRGATFDRGIRDYRVNKDKSVFKDIVTYEAIRGSSYIKGSDRKELFDILENPLISRYDKRLIALRYLDNKKDFSSKIAFVLTQKKGKMEMVKEILTVFRDYYLDAHLLKTDKGEILTPLYVVEEMIDDIEDSFWTSPFDKYGKVKTVFDPAAGSGVYLWAVINKFMKGLKNFGHITHNNKSYNLSDEEIRYKFIVENMIYACEKEKLKLFNWMCILDIEDKYNINVYRGSFLSPKFEDYKEDVWNISDFSLCIGNPPYHRLDGGGTGTAATPIYNRFMNNAIDIANKVLFITPSRWIVGGRGLDKFRKKMILSRKVKYLKDIKDPVTVFRDTYVTGGICYFMWDNDYDGYCEVNNEKVVRNLSKYDIILRDKRDINILDKINLNNTLDNKVLTQRPFKIRSNYNNWKLKGIDTHYIDGIKKAFEKDIRDKNNILNKYKVLISKADGAAYESSRIISRYIIAKPGEACTETYLVCGSFKTKKEAVNYGEYLMTKFSRYLLSLRLISQNKSKEKFKWIPDMLDYKKSYTDKELFKMYNLTKGEIDYINQKIK